ncbi:T9SS type A sorting domain-containing protein [Kaistella flava (ex Peng et al. 2021)]|uniref:T9SS type A sorting domain-containing protein n=1 Tax=Kaistella flava (ex Peng et al. 2021) TaxID=2038776 RepID=A0A7M2Y9V3_9FLAO|nr:T9SS type A sorting domain-containing protein [Kaistella flava (ex Peng et al. 2021)]QOW10364.1 T9SS type A sorting domain-containing protein [Kaistella flava (ex Peng et al. 2021)]
MMKNLHIKNVLPCKLQLILYLFAIHLIFAQSIPSNTRLTQINTLRGSALNLVESTDTHTYHIGTVGAEIGFDSFNNPSVGKDDLYVLKSNTSDGTNVWMKTFNAGSKGVISPKKVYVDSNNSVFIFAQFSGSIKVAGKTIVSNGTDDTFLIKLDQNGNALWINLFNNTDRSFIYNIKFANDSTDLYMIYSQNHLVRMSSTGYIIFNNSYSPGTDLRGIALKNNNIYIAGLSVNSSEVFGTETIIGRQGFIIKGDKNANFNASMQTTGGAIAGADISDIAFDSGGNLLLTGYNSSSIGLTTESGYWTYTFNPNSNFENNRLYQYTAKIDSNLASVSFFRTSTPISTDAIYGIQSRSFSAKLIPYGTSGSFRNIISLGFFDGRNNITNFTLSNGVNITVANAGAGKYQFLGSYDNSGVFDNGVQKQLGGVDSPILAASGNAYIETTRGNRLFTTKAYLIPSNNIAWTKQKTSSIGGSLSSQFSQHLNSSKNEMFFSAIVEGKANFFGKDVNNFTGIKSRYVTRLGSDLLPKWFARFHVDSGQSELNISKDFACVDKDDNFVFLANTSGLTSTFIDAAGNFIDFQQPADNSSKAIIKLDKNGILVWSKQLTSSFAATVYAAVTTDSKGDVYIMGTTTANLKIDGNIITTSGSNNIFLIKISKTGNVLYSKSYQNISAYTFLPTFDAQDNLYIFTEPYGNGNNYVFDGITVTTNAYQLDHIMLKFDSSGNVIWGKNFYGNATRESYSWPNDVVFDGVDFLLSGSYYTDQNDDFVGLDLANIPRVYPTLTYIPFFAKITTSGNVLWQKPVHSNFVSQGNYSNFDVDENKNMYIYTYAKDKISFNGLEYSFDENNGNKILMKIDTSGNLKYFKRADINFASGSLIDVIGEDKINVSGFTSSYNFLNYPINNKYASNLYVATFGNLDSYYLTPTKDYLQLNNIVMENNPDNANTFSFDLINNVDWNAISDQSWLNLSFLSLTDKNNFKNTISGNGDAKIIMSASTNNTGVNRSATVLVSGTGVDSKSIIVTQSFILATGETKTFLTTLYPNPTSDVLNIETKQDISKIEIYDLSGRLLKTSGRKDKQISVSNLNKGMYLIKLHTESGVINSKFIKN